MTSEQFDSTTTIEVADGKSTDSNRNPGTASGDEASSPWKEKMSEKFTLREAAEQMNRTPNAVMKLLTRALTKLKESFGDTESLHLPSIRLDGRELDNDK